MPPLEVSSPAAADLSVIFFGTAELACASLAAIQAIPSFQVQTVVTQPDRPRGRDMKLQPSAVKALAVELGLRVLQPRRAGDAAFVEEIEGFKPDLIVVAAYGQILPQALLDVPAYGALNIHTSLLPRHRGAAPIQWAILEGDFETGVTIMKMDAGLDTGDILTQERTAIADDDNAVTLHDRLAAIGASLLTRTIPDYVFKRITPRPQPPAGVTYARKISKEDGRLDWNLPARVLCNRIRAFTPWPGAFTFENAPGSKLLKLWEARPADGQGPPGEILTANREGILVACGSGVLRVTMLQREGGKRLKAAEFITGHPMKAGARWISHASQP